MKLFLLVDESNPVALYFLFHTEKRIWKDDGTLMVITRMLLIFRETKQSQKNLRGLLIIVNTDWLGGYRIMIYRRLVGLVRRVGG